MKNIRNSRSGKEGKNMEVSINTLLLLVIAIELGLVYVKMGRK
jgi:hypothetical protein